MKGMSKKWKLLGYDTFSSEWYILPGSFASEKDAQTAADRRLDDLERTQPSASSGGQGSLGIQDRVFIQRPDGSKYRHIRRKLAPERN